MALLRPLLGLFHMAIIDVPSHTDYLDVGSDHLQLAWDRVIELLIDANDIDLESDPDLKAEYWEAARRNLLTALALAQQGVEFALKGHIARISPYLLIQNPTGKLPRRPKGSSISFDDFRTIDAQDLVRAAQSFASLDLTENFQEKFETNRRLRNQIIHSTGRKISVEPNEIIENILEFHLELFPDNHWLSDRSNFICGQALSYFGGMDWERNIVCRELEVVLDLLKPSKVKKFFKINKKQRRYSCPGCCTVANHDAGFEIRLAVLTPNSPKATELYCSVCDETFPIKREKCGEAECRGNVIHEELGCLSCVCSL